MDSMKALSSDNMNSRVFPLRSARLPSTTDQVSSMPTRSSCWMVVDFDFGTPRFRRRQ